VTFTKQNKVESARKGGRQSRDLELSKETFQSDSVSSGVGDGGDEGYRSPQF